MELKRHQSVIVIGTDAENQHIHLGDRGRVVWRSKYFPIYKVKVGAYVELFWRDQLTPDED